MAFGKFNPHDVRKPWAPEQGPQAWVGGAPSVAPSSARLGGPHRRRWLPAGPEAGVPDRQHAAPGGGPSSRPFLLGTERARSPGSRRDTGPVGSAPPSWPRLTTLAFFQAPSSSSHSGGSGCNRYILGGDTSLQSIRDGQACVLHILPGALLTPSNRLSRAEPGTVTSSLPSSGEPCSILGVARKRDGRASLQGAFPSHPFR